MSKAPNFRRNLFEVTTDQTTSQTHDNKENGSDSSYDCLLEHENAELMKEIETAETSLTEAKALFRERIETISTKYSDMIETRTEKIKMAKRIQLDEEIKRLKVWHESEMRKLKTIKSHHIQSLLSDYVNLDTEFSEVIDRLKDL